MVRTRLSVHEAYNKGKAFAFIVWLDLIIIEAESSFIFNANTCRGLHLYTCAIKCEERCFIKLLQICISMFAFPVCTAIHYR